MCSQMPRGSFRNSEEYFQATHILDVVSSCTATGVLHRYSYEVRSVAGDSFY